MQLKCNFHTHAKEDPEDHIKYTATDLLHEAKKQNFDCLSLTFHNKFFYPEAIQTLARQLDILLIPGIELTLHRKHIVILGAESTTEKIQTWADLTTWKNSHPDSFILAPHPFYPALSCLHSQLQKHIDLFDGIEHSFFHTKLWNPNRRAIRFAKANHLPLIATSDTHTLPQLPLTHCTVTTNSKTPQAILQSLKSHHFQNHITPLTPLQLLRIYAKMI